MLSRLDIKAESPESRCHNSGNLHPGSLLVLEGSATTRPSHLCFDFIRDVARGFEPLQETELFRIPHNAAALGAGRLEAIQPPLPL